MKHSRFIKAAFLSAALLLVSQTSFATSQTKETALPQTDDVGFVVNPTCDLGRDFKSALKAFSKEISHGEKTLTEKWELEIFRNPETQKWTVLGKARDKSQPSYFLCVMAKGQGDYTTQKWYQQYFAKKPVTEPIPPVARDTTNPAPKIP